MQIYRTNNHYFVGREQGKYIQDVGTINKKYPKSTCFKVTAIESKEVILYNDGSILPLANIKTENIDSEGIRFIGSYDLALRIKKLK